ncbi:alpha-galactosidase [Enterocloster clostridioformis]|uniref:Alpha-galactosidase n=3 Tax=Enterocloster clostridioformis TaxID=1531 RepID=R0B3T0_9FIRM|nr:alpha-galactosidase [Enterocloster clostridioformis]ENY96109.1 alpha-galactosidase [[Clostridium] clostridioforme CM201]ENZ22274.1 alpha-galactosidase [[Clostridium] clostridioforme 90A1]EHG27952.1 hypothetical protein HMPREF9467_04383 [ [[Clostridium] clostridioforme 2_1_49FAA]ENZ00046.1 alpha-galactosidase [[Clostridium] clostridioforme 90B1]ENZ09307.1 alpha-galactosidase [[Clostridium] clostridioforme 90A8]
MGIIYEEKSRQFHLYNDKISYIMTCLPNGQMGQLYYGKRIRHRESFGHLLEFAHRDMAPCVYEDDTTFSLEHIKQEYPGFGTGDMRYPAYGIRRENGSRVSSFVYKSHIIQRGKPELPGLPAAYVEQDEEAWTLKLYLEDPVAGMELVLFYTIYEKMPVLTRSARFVCRGPELVCLERAMSLSLDLPDPRYQMVDLTGAWCRERYVDCHGLHQGVQSIHSMRGHSSHQFNPFICLKRPDAGEDSGEVIGISLVYSGNFLAQAEVDTMETVRVTMGIHPEGFDWPLCPGEEFQTPEAVMVYSGDGLNGMSQVFHQLYRTRLARGYWRDRERPILINNWEATFMDFDEDKILSIADKARELGIELFVLDDGWFGKRDDDTTSLGDWYPDLHKLPDGITGLAGKIRDMGMKFGLWFEPEMVSRDSRLYRAHPDWMLGSTDRPVCTGRHQYVLDFSKDQVVEYIGDRMEEILGDGGVSYVKWDMNRSISDLFSAGRDAQYQGTVYHRQILGVYKLYDRLTRSFPHVLFESCASGGARFDPGILYYAPQGWVSDDTDGVERVKIQYGTSLVYPLSSMGSHVSAIPNHQTQRNVPLAARAAAACFGTFGYELDLNLLAEEEQYQVKEQIRFMKEHRKLIQQGRFYRLISPFEGNEAAWIVVSEDADKAIAAYFRFLQPVNAGFKRLVLKGLNPGIMYRVSGVDYTAYGDELMSAGLILSDGASGVRTSPVPQGDYLSRLFLVEAQP